MRRLESIKKDGPQDSFESLDADDVFLEGVATDARPTGRVHYDHLSSTVATHNSSGDLDKDPNIIVRTMKRALKKVRICLPHQPSTPIIFLEQKNIESFWGSVNKAKAAGLNENDVVAVVQVYGPDAVNLRKMIEAEESAASQGAGAKKNSKGVGHDVVPRCSIISRVFLVFIQGIDLFLYTRAQTLWKKYRLYSNSGKRPFSSLYNIRCHHIAVYNISLVHFEGGSGCDFIKNYFLMVIIILIKISCCFCTAFLVSESQTSHNGMCILLAVLYIELSYTMRRFSYF